MRQIPKKRQILTDILIWTVAAALLYLNVKSIIASEVSVKVTSHSFLSDGFRRAVGNGVQLSYTPKQNGYVFLSHDKIGIYPLGKAFDLTLQGVGFGAKFKVHKYFSVYGQLGYYFVQNSYGGRSDKLNEGMLQAFNFKFHPFMNGEGIEFDQYEVFTKNTFGGTVGFNMDYPVTKNFNLNIGLSLRIIKYFQEMRAFKKEWNYEETGQRWEVGGSQNISSFGLTAGGTYRF